MVVKTGNDDDNGNDDENDGNDVGHDGKPALFSYLNRLKRYHFLHNYI